MANVQCIHIIPHFPFTVILEGLCQNMWKRSLEDWVCWVPEFWPKLQAKNLQFFQICPSRRSPCVESRLHSRGSWTSPENPPAVYWVYWSRNALELAGIPVPSSTQLAMTKISLLSRGLHLRELLIRLLNVSPRNTRPGFFFWTRFAISGDQDGFGMFGYDIRNQRVSPNLYLVLQAEICRV